MQAFHFLPGNKTIWCIYGNQKKEKEIECYERKRRESFD